MTKTINISMPEELLKLVDEAAKGEFATRSDFIRETLVRRIKGQRVVDEWGDEGEWKTLVDFTGVSKDGVPAKEVLKAARPLEK